MTIRFFRVALPVLLMGMAATAQARDVDGAVEQVDVNRGVLVVSGITLHTGPGTDFEDGLRSLADVRVGQRVEVDYREFDGRYYATEIELDD